MENIFQKIYTQKLPESHNLPSYKNFADLLFQRELPAKSDHPLLMGVCNGRPISIDLTYLRNITAQLMLKIHSLQIKKGDHVLLLRPSHSNDIYCALTYIALTSLGTTVTFIAKLHLDQLQELKANIPFKCIFMGRDGYTFQGRETKESNLLEDIAKLRPRTPVYFFARDLKIPLILQYQFSHEQWREDLSSMQDAFQVKSSDKCLITVDNNKFMSIFTHEHLLKSCESWYHAGLLTPSLFGSKGLFLSFTPIIPVISLWNALWNAHTMCILSYEYFTELPTHAQANFVKMAPEHILGSNATFENLLDLISAFPKLKDFCLQTLKALNINGSRFDQTTAKRTQNAFKLYPSNAYTGHSFLMAMNTLIAGELSNSSAGALGNPLPGVSIALKKFDPDKIDINLPTHGVHIQGRARTLYTVFLKAPFIGKTLPFSPIDNIQIHDENEWLHTGDLVEEKDGGLHLVYRYTNDFIKDNFGSKIFYERFHHHYKKLYKEAAFIEIFSLKNTPGLGVIIFVPDKNNSITRGVSRVVKDKKYLSATKNTIEATLERLRVEIEEGEFRHYFIERFAILKVNACMLDEYIKVITSGALRLFDYDSAFINDLLKAKIQLIQQLTGHYKKVSEVVKIDRERFMRSETTRFTSPRRGELLHVANLDKSYIRGKGDKLYYLHQEGKECEVLDFVGGFGGNLLGHRNPKILKEANRFLKGQEIFLFDQGSERPILGECAKELSLEVGKYTDCVYVVRFGSTGAEAVEMALAHAFLERDKKIHNIIRDQKRCFGSIMPEKVREIEHNMRRLIRENSPKIIALKKGFHGHSLSARSVLANFNKRQKFEPMTAMEAIFLDENLYPQIAEIVARETLSINILVQQGREVVEQSISIPGIIAAIAEPVQGEGGVNIINPEVLSKLSTYDFPLILDEIQSGLGRCGSFLASEGVHGHYYLFSKALGGGVAKISALLIEKDRYVDKFDELYSSTFAGDVFSTTMMKKTLEVIRNDEIAKRCKEMGEHIKEQLQKLLKKYPDIFKEARGVGLLQAIELRSDNLQDSAFMRAVNEQEFFGILCSGYLLNNFNIRLLPTLSSPNALRIEPSAYIEKSSISKLMKAFENLATILRQKDYATLLSFLISDDIPKKIPSKSKTEDGRAPAYSTIIEPPAPDAVRVGFINHFAIPDQELMMAEPSLKRLTATERQMLFEKLIQFYELKPFIGFAKNLFGGKIWFLSVVIPADASLLGHLHQMGSLYLETERIQDAIDLAAKHGCKAAALGGYTSIMTKDGLAILPPPGMKITSGNTFTSVVGVRNIIDTCKRRGVIFDDPQNTIAIVGATGNIGQSLTRQLLGEKKLFKKALLIARDQLKLRQLQNEILERTKSSGFELDLQISTDLNEVNRCNLIAIVTNTNEPLIYPHHIDTSRDILIADLSVPSAVSAKVWEMKNVKVMSIFGTVPVPGENDFVISSHTKPGTTFCCSAEAMLIGLEYERTKNLSLTGSIELASATALEELGDTHGFLTSFGVGGFKF
ncbi:MAG: aminotransferase class III-fold pyridoxal phosphate-dependent enzyme [Oligoflexia bacterium]|nr:aminotransferase class III-fold pyridoxal phosphate-dependent enzyme [Oligoflexia bacterium]MBF0366074.1 aminotransferase class III-fold pyridoxal phosphate-dependent enzyme [Oligoflexia bacterium]